MSESPDPRQSEQTVVVFGGSGFVGRRVVERLLALDFRVRIATRHPRRHDREDITSVEADVNDEGAVAAAVAGAFGVVNAISLYVERHGQTFHSMHVEAAERVARHAKEAGVARLCHVSGIGSDPESDSPYIASRGRGEEAVRATFPAATVVRPAAMFGPDDALVVPVSRLLRQLPVFALFGRGRTRLQPPHVDDVADAMARIFRIADPAPLYELAGPRVYSYRDLLELLRQHSDATTLFVPLSFTLWHGLAAVAEQLPSPPITRNQVELMREDNVASGAWPGFDALGITPRSLEDSLPGMLPHSLG